MIESVHRRRVFVTKGENTMKVIVLAPNEKPTVKGIDSELESMQGVVDGMIEAIYPFEDKVALVCNEEGKLCGLDPNFALVMNKRVMDVIVGTCFICGLGEEDFCSLSDELCEKYLNLFECPMGFIGNGYFVPAYEI